MSRIISIRLDAETVSQLDLIAATYDVARMSGNEQNTGRSRVLRQAIARYIVLHEPVIRALNKAKRNGQNKAA